MNRIQNQIISLEGEKYAIPQENLEELVRIPAEEIKNRIDQVGNMPVIRLRNEFLPLLNLAEVLGIEPQIEQQKDDRNLSASSALKLAIVHSGEYRYGLVIDQFCEPEEVEVLPAGRYLDRAGIYEGTAILKDESASLVLDILEIAHAADLASAGAFIDDSLSDPLVSDDLDLEEFSLITFRNSDAENFAADLGFVERLERFRDEDFEAVGNQTVIQYRNGSLPVYELSNFLKCSRLDPSKIWEVVVFRHGDFLAGLKVRQPVDTVECRLAVDTATFNTPPAAGTVILDNKSTLLIDVPAMIDAIKRRTVS